MLTKIFTMILFIYGVCHCQNQTINNSNPDTSFISFINDRISHNLNTNARVLDLKQMKEDIEKNSNSNEDFAILSKKFIRIFDKCFNGKSIKEKAFLSDKILITAANKIAVICYKNGKQTKDINQLKVAKAFFDSIPTQSTGTDFNIDLSKETQEAIDEINLDNSLFSPENIKKIRENSQKKEAVNIPRLIKNEPVSIKENNKKLYLKISNDNKVSNIEQELNKREQELIKRSMELNLREQNLLQKDKEIAFMAKKSYVHNMHYPDLYYSRIRYVSFHK